ncbi:aminotransferase class IV [Salinimonas chungwhensis]|uniref:aminotransferase class IV n=1 Tax=Salinimonas chungwhensis TaxID=265425 RepID=UPI00036EDD11|nr:aminotransferase class IV [Salinimonas chungwhensis]
MTLAFLNDEYLPLDQARISPMDRGFLFGDGIYEVIPTQNGKAIGLSAHLQRMSRGLNDIEIPNPMQKKQWESVIQTLVTHNATEFESSSIGVYLHVSRGTAAQRNHAYNDKMVPTVFCYAFEMAAPPVPDRTAVKGLHVALGRDLRWQRCHIKSTSLLGNVLHYQQGVTQGKQETILLNQHDEVTEAASCNVFAVIDGQIVTPALDHQLLPGITRQLVIQSLREEGTIVRERAITKNALLQADEVWLSSSSKEITPVLSIDGRPVGEGCPGPVWEESLRKFNKHKFTF